jgi:O-antigen ligase
MATVNLSRWQQLFFASFCVVVMLANVQFLTVDGVSEEASAVKLYHIVSAGLVLWMPLAWCLRTLPWTVHVFFITVGISTAAAFSTYGFSGRAILIPYALFIACLGASAVQRLGRETVLKVICHVFTTLHFIIAMRVMFYLATAGDVPRAPGGRPDLLFFYTGGNNLEASWLAISVVLFSRSKLFLPLTLNAAFVAVVYGSRTGLLLTVASVGFVLFTSPGRVKWMLRGVGLVSVGIVLLMFTELGESMLERFEDIGDSEEYGSSSRLDMWATAIEAIQRNPFGYGIGNSQHEISARQSMGIDHVTNVHNVFLQMALDGGIQTLIAWLLVICQMFNRAWKRQSDHFVSGFLIIYLCGSMVQFTGYETFAWLMLGILVAELATAPATVPAQLQRPHPQPAPQRHIPGTRPVPIPIPVPRNHL